MSVEIAGMPPENPKQREFMGQAPIPPPFLADITDDSEVQPPQDTGFQFQGNGTASPTHDQWGAI